ncbi:MAG: large-conductance mechanosensitive channel protein MscL [Xanthomonadales bacterium]|nr:large-conductance mechanosensitive channel protein MscL [Xanthomonadales bacterium]
MGMINEFKDFISKGNVVDLAVGVIIGAAFGKIVTALVEGVVMPTISIITGGSNFKDWKHVITPAVMDPATGKEKVAEVAIKYGDFIQTCIDFLLIAFVIFLAIKAYNRMRQPAVAADAPPSEEVLLLREIRDNLKK